MIGVKDVSDVEMCTFVGGEVEEVHSFRGVRTSVCACVSAPVCVCVSACLCVCLLSCVCLCVLVLA